MLRVKYFALVLCCALAEEPTCNTKEECDLDHTSLLQTYASLYQHHATEKALDPTPVDDPKNLSDRTLQVTFHNAEDARNAAALIMRAMEEAGVTLNEWLPVSYDGHNHTLDANDDTYPFVWDFTVRHMPSQSDMQSDDADDDFNEELVSDFLPKIEPPPPSHSNVSFLEVEDVDPDFKPHSRLNESLLEVNAAKGKKNAKQKKWVAKQLAKLEGDICARPPAYHAKRRFVMSDDWFKDFGGYIKQDCTDNEWRTDGSIFPMMDICYTYCDVPPGKKDYKNIGGTTCSYDCFKEGLEHIGVHCTFGYCAANTGACAHRLVKIGAAAIDVISNTFPPFKSVGAVVKAVKTGSKAIIKKALKKAAKKQARKLLKKSKKNLKKYMKDKKKELKKELKDEETQEAILEGGAELFALEGLIIQKAGATLEAQALDLVKEVDPTGIADLVGALEADSCDDKTITPMPLDGIEEEVATETCTDCWCAHNSGGYWGTYSGCQLESNGRFSVKCSVRSGVYTYYAHSCPAPKLCTPCTCTTNTGGFWGTYGSCSAPHNNAGTRYNVKCEFLDGDYTYLAHSCPPQPPTGCLFEVGDGSGGWEEYIGDAKDPMACAAMVASTRPSANGATYSTNGYLLFCYAEYGQTYRNSDVGWQNCKFK